MDPVANLQEQRELARSIIAQRDSRDVAAEGDSNDTEIDLLQSIANQADALAELVQSLDEWRRNGGFDPYSAIEPVVLVIRDPDYENNIQTFGMGVHRIIDVDLGSQFNGPKDFRAMRAVDQEEWIADMRYEFKGLPEDHPARQSFESLVTTMLEP